MENSFWVDSSRCTLCPQVILRDFVDAEQFSVQLIILPKREDLSFRATAVLLDQLIVLTEYGTDAPLKIVDAAISSASAVSTMRVFRLTEWRDLGSLTTSNDVSRNVSAGAGAGDHPSGSVPVSGSVALPSAPNGGVVPALSADNYEDDERKMVVALCPAGCSPGWKEVIVALTKRRGVLFADARHNLDGRLKNMDVTHLIFTIGPYYGQAGGGDYREDAWGHDDKPALFRAAIRAFSEFVEQITTCLCRTVFRTQLWRYGSFRNLSSRLRRVWVMFWR